MRVQASVQSRVKPINWQAGLEYFWDSRFTKSLDYLNLISQSYPIHPTVNQVIDDAKEGIKEGRDVDLLFGLRKEYFYLVAGVLGAAVIAALALLMLRARGNRLPPTPPSAPLPVQPPPASPVETVISQVSTQDVAPTASPPASPALQ